MEAIDFTCPDCESPFQLKSLSRPFAARIVDAAYRAMRQAIVENRTPNLVLLHYDPACWEVKNLVLVPRVVFSLSLLERRKPLGPTARRRGWVGCNIMLANVPPDARIPIVADGIATSPTWVREQYARLRPLEKLGHEARGWRLDVLNVVRAFGREEFSLADVYACSVELARLHPHNLHVHDKIRQQLQRLRNLGFVEFVGRGNYRLV
jgi:type II restriction enzyme